MGLNTFSADSEGNVPLWDAILGKHESVIKVLVDNGATLSSGDVGQFACFAAEQNDVDLLKEIIKFGGDVTSLSSCGTTALHKAVCEDKVEIVKFLIEQGADIDKPDVHRWTSRALADHQGHEEIIALFQTKEEPHDKKGHRKTMSLPPEVQEPPYLKKYSSESSIPRINQEDKTLNSTERGFSSNSHLKWRASDFQNSLAGIITSGRKKNEGKFKALFFSSLKFPNENTV